MRWRCRYPKHNRYANYGGRGIKVCERWLGSNGFKNFLADMGNKPSKGHQLDRYPDKNGNYEPGNCRWATPQEQMRNTRRNLLLTHQGKTQCVAAWAAETGLRRRTIEARVHRGWSHERALTALVS